MQIIIDGIDLIEVIKKVYTNIKIMVLQFLVFMLE